MPWLDFTLPDAMNKLGAVNVAYLFKPNMTGFYLTFRAFFYGELEAKYGKYLPLYLKNKSRHIREFLEESNKLRDDFVFSMDFSENTAVMKKHSAGTIIAKYYEKGNVPSDEELINDLNYFLELYQFVIDNYEDKTDLSVDEWVEVLENEEIIDEKMFSILDIMYNMDDYSATTGQISEKREEIGFDNEKSYNSIIISNSRRIKEFLNKKPIFNDDGTENYWTRFFYGKKVDGSFQFKLQDNLNEAFSRVDRINDSGVESESFDDININNEFEHKLEVEPMSKEENNYNSFYDYLTKNEYLFDKETIENYLLSLKVKPFAILTGNSGTGKTKLSQLFAQYLENNFSGEIKKSGSISTEVTVGKSSESGGWSLNRNDLKELIPIDELENRYSILVDGVPAEGDLKLNPRLFYKGNELKQHLEDLAREDARQKVPLQILLDGENIIENDDSQDLIGNESVIVSDDSQELFGNESVIENVDSEYIAFKTKKSTKVLNNFSLGNKTVKVLLDRYKYYYQMDFYFDGYKIRRTFYTLCYAQSDDEKLINHLNSLDNYHDIEIKIRKEDILNTFLDENSVEKRKISFNRRIKPQHYWVFPNTEWENITNIKRNYTWNAIVDGKRTKFDFGIRRVDFWIDPNEDEGFKEIFDNKNNNDTIRIEADLSSIKGYEWHPNIDLEEELGFILLNGNGNIIEHNSNHVIHEEIEEDNSEIVCEENKIIQSNYKIIPVGANWTENRHIVGYYNVITNEYQDTPAYKLIDQANNSTEPYFLILDEMNLSHVERYFADFLSAIESGEKIPLYGEEELTLPSNLFIIGTVNVDETTYMFSPKVLDRANVIEFETYSASDYMNNKINLEPPSGNISYLEDPLEGNYIREYGIDELRDLFAEVTVDGEPFWNKLTEEITTFQEILKKSGFDFGFRVINEIVRFMAVAWEYENKPQEFTEWKRYFDACIKQKMLPKLHGSEKIIGQTLKELFNASVGDHYTYETAKYPQSARKLKEMREVLRKQRYVSFIN